MREKKIMNSKAVGCSFVMTNTDIVFTIPRCWVGSVVSILASGEKRLKIQRASYREREEDDLAEMLDFDLKVCESMTTALVQGVLPPGQQVED